MIYLSNITDAQVAFIPKNGDAPAGSYTLRLRSTVGLSVEVHDVIDLRTSDIYHNVSLSLPADIADGEYEYELSSGANVLSTGLIVIGESSSSSQYEKTIQYEQYKAE